MRPPVSIEAAPLIDEIQSLVDILIIGPEIPVQLLQFGHGTDSLLFGQSLNALPRPKARCTRGDGWQTIVRLVFEHFQVLDVHSLYLACEAPIKGALVLHRLQDPLDNSVMDLSRVGGDLWGAMCVQRELDLIESVVQESASLSPTEEDSLIIPGREAAPITGHTINSSDQMFQGLNSKVSGLELQLLTWQVEGYLKAARLKGHNFESAG